MPAVVVAVAVLIQPTILTIRFFIILPTKWDYSRDRGNIGKTT